MTRRRSSGARPERPAAVEPAEDSNGTIGEYCSGDDTAGDDPVREVCLKRVRFTRGHIRTI